MNSNQISAISLAIHTVAPTPSIGEVVIAADKRGKDLPDAERIRRVVLPVGTWGELSAGLQTPKGYEAAQGLTDLLRDGLRKIAGERLRDVLAENPMQRTVPMEDYSIAALLAWNADSATSRGSITFTREQVEKWYPTSKVFTTMATKGQQWTDYVGKRFAALAAKNHGLKKEADATKLIALLAEDAATGDALVIDLIGRLSHIEASFRTRSADAISMDDL